MPSTSQLNRRDNSLASSPDPHPTTKALAKVVPVGAIRCRQLAIFRLNTCLFSFMAVTLYFAAPAVKRKAAACTSTTFPPLFGTPGYRCRWDLKDAGRGQA